jgi:hypothetical protein
MKNNNKVKAAARRVQGKKNKNSFWSRVWRVISWPFRKIAQLCKWFWKWVCSLNFIGLLNIALLVSIIVLFSLLIIDIVGCCKPSVVVVSQPVPVVQRASTRNIVNRQPVLPISQSKTSQPVNVVPVKQSEVKIAQRQIARQKNTLMGDVIIDSRGAGTMLKTGAKVEGNLYLQNMHKYTLPCNVRVNGNLFLRDVGLLQFCGEFIVTGNIYVSPRSSFGPIPKKSHLGGYVVL